jgi:DNA-binding HxlR family transcriptional regulator
MTARDDQSCPAEHTIRVVGGAWKVPILFHLRGGGAMRFSELRRALGRCSAKVLTQQLRELEDDGVVSRKIYAEVPPRVEYSLTPFGKTLRPVIVAMVKWGKCHQSKTSRRIGPAA